MEGTIVVGRDCPRNVDCRLGSCRIDSSKHCSLIHTRLQTKHTPLYQFFNSLLTIGEFVIFFTIVFDLYFIVCNSIVPILNLVRLWSCEFLMVPLEEECRKEALRRLGGQLVVGLCRFHGKRAVFKVYNVRG
jgi:hypothetical protein